MFIYIYMCVCIHIYIYIYVYICKYIYILTHCVCVNIYKYDNWTGKFSGNLKKVLLEFVCQEQGDSFSTITATRCKTLHILQHAAEGVL